MRRLILLRHAKAETSEPGMEDHARRLVERGRKDAAKMGAYMAGHGLIPDRVAVSPAARAQETWKSAATAFRGQPATQSAEAIYDATPRDLMGVITATPTSSHCLLIVGHNPGLHEVAVLLVASGDIDTRERLREKLPTAGLIVIDFPLDDWSLLHPQSGRLERFVSPKWLDTATN